MRLAVLAAALVALVLASGHTGGSDVLDRIKTEEGFSPKPYSDSRGVLTIGYGTNLAIGITEDEAAFLLHSRLTRVEHCLQRKWGPWRDMPGNVRDALTDMGYQLGCEGVLEFHDMLAALGNRDWTGAQAAALASKWARETPKRAHRVADELTD